ncbi:MAG: hypothetical protein GAK45_00731 [Pseudomonas citronellolis]|nr:MAG: hypothetical protein GAK45_00731 [Pseudomonas citronellolis]
MTHAAHRQSWIASANGHPDFPLQNLPLGIFSPPGQPPRGGVAIGERIFDLRVALEAGLFDGSAAEAARAASQATLNAFFAQGAAARQALRQRLQALLDAASPERARLEALGAALLPRAAECSLHLPAQIGDYTDFYVGIHHANNVGRLFRPDNPLLPNYKHVPIGYHGRASTVLVSGSEVRRPLGQTLAAGAEAPSLGPSRRLDYELELGIWIGAGNALGEPIGIDAAEAHVAGYGLLNDWSARDVQAWEYQPLGPFLAKNFATSVSPWVISAEALEPFRRPQPARPEGDPKPLPYLWSDTDQQRGAFDIQLEVLLSSARMREANLPPLRLALSNSLNMYWTVAQMVTHHSVGGCRLQPGDLFGSDTLSGLSDDALGSLLESTQGGKRPLELPGGEQRTFLEDGDEVILRAFCEAPGQVRIGFGECRGRLLPARNL